ncbi:M20/M25/M40 family metallo-hydrolase [Novosphingobium profundi]|uniref:M20/M25/M40 family metallo-hydrolase n=1 Tax=Novosphingobium profundi TaxID=1774954 RepID=UPI001FE97271|nr:M20/M25/M40 family metallo-hydrolase [Novosphingobium profundi]
MTLLAATAALALAATGTLTATGARAATSEDQAAATLLKGAKFAKAKESLKGDYDRIIQDIITLTEIEAPPFKEDARGAAYMAMLKAEGLSDVERDEVGNVMGLRKGTGGGPLIVVTAHLDTVFPGGTNVKVRREGDKLYAPGIGDDTSSLPVLLAFIRAMNRAGYTTKADILFMGNVGEEGPGDLRGSRYLFQKGKYKDAIKYFISFEPGEAGRVTNAGTGSRRYKVTFKGPGGHSFGAFGLVNPAYAMANAMVDFATIQAPAQPKTTYNVGILEGGTSVNSIPFATAMTIDMRSNGKAELAAEEKQFLAMLQPAVDKENAARSTANGKITYDAQLIGDRPVGNTPESAHIVEVATAVVRQSGLEPRLGAGSTDSNIPMSLGIEAVTLGSGFETFRAHSLDEGLTMNPPQDLANMATGLATVLTLAEAR